MACKHPFVVFAFLGVITSACLLASPRQASGAAVVIGTPHGTSYMLYDHFGGTWCDAEKSPLKDYDDNMCWAAAASNALQWTGWGKASGLTTTDQIFSYYQDHWINSGNDPKNAMEWWFSGTPRSSVDVAGGGFHKDVVFKNYFQEYSHVSNCMDYVKNYLGIGACVVLSVVNTTSGGNHSITCWGYTYEPGSGQYDGVWVTDSDDNKSSVNPDDTLRYYDVVLMNNKWYLKNFYDTTRWYIYAVQGLTIPEPMTLAILALGSLGLMRRRRRA